MIIAIGGVKGGTGKSTVATNLTVMRSQMGRRVLLVDADSQKSSCLWVGHRKRKKIETNWTTIQLQDAAVREEILELSKYFDDVIIDAGGRDTQSQRGAASVADAFFAVFQPRAFDVWTLGDLLIPLSETKYMNPKVQYFALMNRCDQNREDFIYSKNVIEESGEFKCLSSSLTQRKAFAKAAFSGLGVCELKPEDKKASIEMQAVFEEIFGIKDANSKNVKDGKKKQKSPAFGTKNYIKHT